MPSCSAYSPPNTVGTAYLPTTYNDIYNLLAAAGAAPAVHIMDNESSTAFQPAIAANKCKLQLIPPHVH